MAKVSFAGWHFAMTATVVVGACSFDWDAFDPRNTATTTTTTSTTGTGGVGGEGAGGAGGRGGGGATGGAGGQAPTVLVDRGLLTRYHLNEASSGMAPTQVMDAAPNPLPLTIDYGELVDPPTGGAGGTGGAAGVGGSPPNMQWTEVDGHRGMQFFRRARSGGASSDVANTKVSTLDGSTQATIECVAEIEEAGGGTTCSRLYHVGVVNNGNLTMCTEGQQLSFRFNGEESETWAVDHASLGRGVFHLVLDTSLADADRVRLYVNGTDQGVGALHDSPPAELATIIAIGGRHVVGNRNSEDASFEGVLYYCALYSVALTAAEVANNALLLAATDD